MDFTILRDNFYLDVLPLFADAAGVIRGPAGDGRVAAVARADVADVAVEVLRDPGAHVGATYTLTGPEALTLAEVAERAGVATGRRLRFEDETPPEAYASRRAAYPDAADWQLDAWVSTYQAIADGSCADGHRRRTARLGSSGAHPRAGPGAIVPDVRAVISPIPRAKSSGTIARWSGGQAVRWCT